MTCLGTLCGATTLSWFDTLAWVRSPPAVSGGSSEKKKDFFSQLLRLATEPISQPSEVSIILGISGELSVIVFRELSVIVKNLKEFLKLSFFFPKSCGKIKPGPTKLSMEVSQKSSKTQKSTIKTRERRQISHPLFSSICNKF